MAKCYCVCVLVYVCVSVCDCECVYVCAGVEQKVFKLILKNVVNTQKFLATFTQKQHNNNSGQNQAKQVEFNNWTHCANK